MSFQEDSLEEGSDDESQEEVIERKVMFNDTFGVRGDYLKGNGSSMNIYFLYTLKERIIHGLL